MKRFFLLLFIFIALVTAFTACTQSLFPRNEGTTSTPAAPTPFARPTTRPSGTRALAMDARGENLYQATSDGLFASGDEGKTWHELALPNEIAYKSVSQVALRRESKELIPAESPDTLFIAGEDIGIWRSHDGGKTWLNATRDLGSGRVTALTLHSNGYPRDESKGLYVWIAGVGVMESHDDGESWKRAADTMVGLDDHNVTALTHTPLPESMNTGWLYASTASGAYLSMDCF